MYYHLVTLHSSGVLTSGDPVFQLCNRLVMYVRMKLLLSVVSSFKGNTRHSYGYQKISVYVYFMTDLFVSFVTKLEF